MSLKNLKKQLNELRKEMPSAERYENLYNAFIDDYNNKYVTKINPDSITKVMNPDINPELTDNHRQIIWNAIIDNQVTDLESLQMLEPIRNLRLRLIEYPMPVLSKEDY